MTTAVLDFAKSLIGKPYCWYRASEPILNVENKFYASNMPVPSIDQIETLVCTGLINLMRRFQGLTVPGCDEKNPFAGTTGVWFEYLQEKGWLEQIDYQTKYPTGTLLIRNFHDIETDQGHVAVVIENNRIIHSFPTKPYSEIGIVGQTAITVGFEKNYFTHVCMPDKWLFEN